MLGRSLLVGAASGLFGGALIFFVFGFIGFSGASFVTKLENGWNAALDPGLRKGLAAGLGLALVLAAAVLLWTVVAHFNPPRARPWLSAVAAAMVVLYNLESLRNIRGWDGAGIATVLGIALLVGVIVWIASPWALRRGTQGRRPGEGLPSAEERGLHRG